MLNRCQPLIQKSLPLYFSGFIYVIWIFSLAESIGEPHCGETRDGDKLFVCAPLSVNPAGYHPVEMGGSITGKRATASNPFYYVR